MQDVTLDARASNRRRFLRAVARFAITGAIVSYGCSSGSTSSPEQSSPITQGDECEGAEEAYDEAQRALGACRLEASDSACAGQTGSDCEACIANRCSDAAAAAKQAATVQTRCTDTGVPLEVHASFECSARDAAPTSTNDR
ncbi:MAG: hypothetical protein U0169_21105 [Polyangiaceae bacterium]